jgi:hypothetical protein
MAVQTELFHPLSDWLPLAFSVLRTLKHEFVVEFSVLTVLAASSPFPFSQGLSRRVDVLLVILRHWLQCKVNKWLEARGW